MTRPTQATRRRWTCAAFLVAVVTRPLLAQDRADSVQRPAAGGAGPTAQTSVTSSLSLRTAIQQGLEYNLTAVGLRHLLTEAQGRQQVARSALRPNVIGTLTASEQRVNVSALGVRFDLPIPGYSLPAVVGPFNVVELRARLTQSIVDRVASNNYRTTTELLRASELLLEDSRNLVVLSVAGAYLRTIAGKAGVESARVQVDTATALLRRTTEQRDAGLATPIDVNRAQAQLLTQQQRLVSLQNDVAKQKITLARLIGMSPGGRFDVSDDVAFEAPPALTVEQALSQAAVQRADLKAAEARQRAAQLALDAARAERLPSLYASADVGASQAGSAQGHGTFSLAGTVRIPLWEGGRAGGQVTEASAELAQRQAELDDLKAEIEGDVRKAYLDLEANSSHVEVARRNLEVTRDNLVLTRQRFDAGVSDNADLVQSQESVAMAELTYIDSVFAHNVAKLDLARALGRAWEDLPQFLQIR
jgi:outer membrane protein TolC